MTNPEAGAAPAPRLAFRADIEGLRAVAILLVVAAHAGLPALAGGFIGVDVFFVLSGFLITGLLLRESAASGRIDLLSFYARRLRRLLPGLQLMVLATGIAAALLVAPQDQARHAETAVAAVLWASNIFFALVRLEYFGSEVADNLFLHTWSLGVEEQFYLVWPVLVMALLGVWSRPGGGLSEARLRTGMVLAVLVCFPLSWYLTRVQPTWGFYLMPSRAWQFALGALAAIACGVHRDAAPAWIRSAPARALAAPLGWCGLLGVLGSAVLISPASQYPGVLALAPSVATAAVLIAGSVHPRGGAGTVLSLRPMQWIGQWSYSWYLWHWPVLLLGGALLPPLELPGTALLALASLVPAVAAFHLLERPVRRSARLAARPGLTIVGGLLLMALLAAAGLHWREASRAWSDTPEQRAFTEVRKDLPVIYPMGCDDWFYSSDVKVCGFGQQDAPRTAVLIGDSILGQWFPALVARYTRPGWRLAVLTKSSCPMVDESYVNGRIMRRFTECDDWRPRALETAAGYRPDVVILGSGIAYPFRPEQWAEGTRRVLESVAPAAGRVLIVASTHGLGLDGPDCLAARAWRAPIPGGRDRCEAPAGSPHEREIVAALRQAAAGFRNVDVLDLNELVCPAGVCAAERQGVIVYRDTVHLSATFVGSLAGAVGRRLDEEGVP